MFTFKEVIYFFPLQFGHKAGRSAQALDYLVCQIIKSFENKNFFGLHNAINSVNIILLYFLRLLLNSRGSVAILIIMSLFLSGEHTSCRIMIFQENQEILIQQLVYCT